jgi:hypothetical protein
MAESEPDDPLMVVPATLSGSRTYQFSAIETLDEFLAVVEEVADDLDPEPADRLWLRRAVHHLDLSVAASLQGSRETLERAYHRLKGEIELEDMQSSVVSERVGAYRQAIAEIESFLSELNRIEEAPSQNEEHLLSLALIERRASLINRLKRADSSFFSPGPGPHETTGWKRVIERFSWLVRQDEERLQQTVDKVSTLRRSLLIRSTLLESTLDSKAHPVPKHVDTVPPTLEAPHSEIGDMRSDLAVVEALRSGGTRGLDSKGIIAFLGKHGHPLARRQEPIKSVYNEISRLKREQPGLIESHRIGREVLYRLVAPQGSVESARASTAPPSPTLFDSIRPEGTLRTAPIAEAIESIIRCSGSTGVSISGILEALKAARHAVSRKPNPRNIVVYEINKLKSSRARMLICTKVGREVIYKLR